MHPGRRSYVFISHCGLSWNGVKQEDAWWELINDFSWILVIKWFNYRIQTKALFTLIFLVHRCLTFNRLKLAHPRCCQTHIQTLWLTKLGTTFASEADGKINSRRCGTGSVWKMTGTLYTVGRCRYLSCSLWESAIQRSQTSWLSWTFSS